MKKNYTISYLKKNINIKELINGMDLNEFTSTSLYTPIDAIFRSFKVVEDATWKDLYLGNSFDPYYRKKEFELEKFKKSIQGTEFQEKIRKFIFDGSLLPKLNNNFKLEIYFEMKSCAHYLIYSKLNKKYYYIFAERKWDKKKNKPINGPATNQIITYFKKKINKSFFFKTILEANEDRENEFMEENKSIEYEMRERLWEKTAYMSSKGVDYVKVYKKVYEKYLKKQYG
jgi:hypothetical protein|tara:strand:- start:15 stop:701 length:687 start_codon:yes stop_codon:yes gene_type:complete